MDMIKKISLKSLKIDTFIISLMAFVPIIHLAFGDWFDTWFNTISILCFYLIFKNKENISFDWKKNWIFILIFISYPIEIFISQLFRWQWRIHDYLDQSRFLLALPVFIYLSNIRFDYGKLLQYTVPISLILSFITTKYFYSDFQYGDRFSNNFSDPLAFGQITLSMSLILISTFFVKNLKSEPLLNLLKVTGIVFGIIISVKTQSRTGWASLIVISIFLIWINRTSISKWTLYLFVICVVSFLLIGFEFIPSVHIRVLQAYSEIATYPWHGGMAPETSVGQRITFYRIGWFYITHGHWYGWGERGFKDLMNSQELLSFSTKQTIEFCYIHLFHNELLTQTVRYGILGVLGYLFVFILPLIKLIRLYVSNKNNVPIQLNSLIVVVLIITQMIAGVSDEVINLKHMVMFYSILVAGLIASVNTRRL